VAIGDTAWLDRLKFSIIAARMLQSLERHVPK
jgi:hypothetical protein